MFFWIQGPLFQKSTKVDIENQHQIKSSENHNGNDVKQVREEKKNIKNSPRTFSNLSPTSPTQISVKHVSSKWN
jgi:hypothetical protein